MSIREWYAKLDPEYATKHAHQQLFISMMERAQELEPCAKDHAADVVEVKDGVGGFRRVDWHTHTSRCYSAKTIAQATLETRSS